jgi:holo-[acyl-carrier protein] synthase
MRVGIDLVTVEEVRDALDTHAERYLQRLYTPGELADCTSPTGFDAERLAGRFAAKEAVVKVLRPCDTPLPLRTIEVRRNESGSVEIALSGEAEELARAQELTGFALSISHEAGYATAVVIASVSDFRNTDDSPMEAS